ncbi:hypothetical protein MTO96_020693 [Rhipicephalus appendiculatus]
MTCGCPVPALQASRCLAGKGDPAAPLSRGSFSPDLHRLQFTIGTRLAPGPGPSAKSGDMPFLEELYQPLATGVAGDVFSHAPGFTTRQGGQQIAVRITAASATTPDINARCQRQIQAIVKSAQTPKRARGWRDMPCGCC